LGGARSQEAGLVSYVDNLRDAPIVLDEAVAHDPLLRHRPLEQPPRLVALRLVLDLGQVLPVDGLALGHERRADLAELLRRLRLVVAQGRNGARLEQHLHDEPVPMEGREPQRRLAATPGQRLWMGFPGAAARPAGQVEVRVDIFALEARTHSFEITLLARVQKPLVGVVALCLGVFICLDDRGLFCRLLLRWHWTVVAVPGARAARGRPAVQLADLIVARLACSLGSRHQVYRLERSHSIFTCWGWEKSCRM